MMNDSVERAIEIAAILTASVQRHHARPLPLGASHVSAPEIPANLLAMSLNLAPTFAHSVTTPVDGFERTRERTKHAECGLGSRGAEPTGGQGPASALRGSIRRRDEDGRQAIARLAHREAVAGDGGGRSFGTGATPSE